MTTKSPVNLIGKSYAGKARAVWQAVGRGTPELDEGQLARLGYELDRACSWFNMWLDTLKRPMTDIEALKKIGLDATKLAALLSGKANDGSDQRIMDRYFSVIRPFFDLDSLIRDLEFLGRLVQSVNFKPRHPSRKLSPMEGYVLSLARIYEQFTVRSAGTSTTDNGKSKTVRPFCKRGVPAIWH